ncbi:MULTISPECIES: nuclear transport factor 2 family protein [Pseudomonas]|uniref:nuclear transport factor 2 family protein n=1 Tax=Pseudomonas TaxID=286 RepID=UPI001BEB2074|nr:MULTISPECIES: nuclear transport factor 2 family protein [Pseudomonas]MBT2341641.1 nuclear transport factor 2 family protein [Pseudomonas fluorescens]MCD4531110.1 nuclear transport factor 2 family protein [Pseudomonas sp. C3-2018]
MKEYERLCAIEDIRQAKARYVRGLDTGNPAMVRGMLADDCVLDFRKCWVDPATGVDLLPEMNFVMHGAESWSGEGFASLGARSQHTSAHHLYSSEISFKSDTAADAIWAFSARLFMPTGGRFKLLTSYGYYVETYEKVGSEWKLKTMRLDNLRAEGE